MSVGVSEAAKNRAPSTSPTPDSDCICRLMIHAEYFTKATMRFPKTRRPIGKKRRTVMFDQERRIEHRGSALSAKPSIDVLTEISVLPVRVNFWMSVAEVRLGRNREGETICDTCPCPCRRNFRHGKNDNGLTCRRDIRRF